MILNDIWRLIICNMDALNTKFNSVCPCKMLIVVNRLCHFSRIFKWRLKIKSCVKNIFLSFMNARVQTTAKLNYNDINDLKYIYIKKTYEAYIVFSYISPLIWKCKISIYKTKRISVFVLYLNFLVLDVILLDCSDSLYRYLKPLSHTHSRKSEI